MHRLHLQQRQLLRLRQRQRLLQPQLEQQHNG
jgi:hypothetical protein